VTHSPYARAPDLLVTPSRIAVQYLILIFHQHTEAKDVITSKQGCRFLFASHIGHNVIRKEEEKA
jgi:hypothetical protein